MIYFKRFATRRQAKAKIFEYVEVLYNHPRSRSSPGYKSPAEFEETKRVS